MQSIVNFFSNMINNIKYSDLLQNLQLPKIDLFDIIEILIIVIAIYRLLISLKDTRAWIVFKGVVVLMGVYFIAYAFSFSVVMTIFKSLMSILAIGIIILFQGELRKILENIGTKDYIVSFDIKKLFKQKEVVEKKYVSDKTISNLVEACKEMGKAKTGALIVIKKDIPLNEYISTGIDIDSKISTQMLMQIFEHNTPLHDGALIIENDRLASATCYLPLSENSKISKDLGTRHRAGIGISEVTDCLVVIVSEETGHISIAQNGKLSRKLTEKDLENRLKSFQSPKVKKIDKKEEINNRKKRLMKNKRYKFISILIGAMLWLLLMNANDPIITQTINNIPVKVQNEETLLDMEHTYNIISGKYATIVIKGRRSIVDNITADNFHAYADFKNLSIVNSVPISISTNKDVEIIENDNNMIVKIDKLSSIECPITVKTTGQLKDSLYIDSIDVIPGNITITGPTSLLNTIGEVVIQANVTSIYDGYSENLIPVIYDKNGKIIDMETISLSNEEIKIVYNIFNTKEVDLKLNINNMKFENGEIISYFTEPSKIRIAAPSEILKITNELEISVDLNINDDAKTSNMIKTINLNDYILNKNIFIKEQNSTISINFSYEQYIEKTFSINTNNIKIKNASADLDYKIEGNEYNVTIKGLKDKIEKFNILLLHPYVDVNGMTEGINNIKLCMDTHTDIKEILNTNIKILVEKKIEEE